MNTPIVAQSTAFQFGQRDALAGISRKTEDVFTGTREQSEYARGYTSVSQDTKPIVTPNYKRNDREYTRRTDSSVDAIFAASEARDKRIDRMIAKTALENPRDAGDILWLV